MNLGTRGIPGGVPRPPCWVRTAITPGTTTPCTTPLSKSAGMHAPCLRGPDLFTRLLLESTLFCSSQFIDSVGVFRVFSLFLLIFRVLLPLRRACILTIINKTTENGRKHGFSRKFTKSGQKKWLFSEKWCLKSPHGARENFKCSPTVTHLF